MAKQLIVNVNEREKKIAIIEDDKVTEFYIERGEQHQGIVGNIYKGRVMRVLPGMQSAFVDIGLERDAFLYVSDFFDEEEEFERIVIDKSKKGTPDAEHAAAEEVALNRVEREQRIEATQERVEPLQEEERVVVAEQPESAEASRRRGRRGRRRSRWEKADEAPQTAQEREPFEVPNTPFVAGDPSIERIVDEEENAAANGAMFKDGRLHERIFDQIHAVEFNMEDDFRNASVGSLLSDQLTADGFERVDDDESEPVAAVREGRRPIEAHVAGFVDDFDVDILSRKSFERISDDEEESLEAESAPARRGRKTASAGDDVAEPAKKKRGTRTAAAANKTSKKKASSKRPAKKRAATSTEGEEKAEVYVDAEATVTESQSRGEFATRRGGRRRRRGGSKGKPAGTAEEAKSSTNGADDEVEQPVEAVAEVPPAVVQAPVAPETSPRERSGRPHGREQREQRGGHRGPSSRRDRHQPAITDLLSEGQEILVQIAKEPIAKKGARITSHIALPGRFLVFMPTVNHVGVSRKIESDGERRRLKEILLSEKGEASGGFIVRTAASGASEEELRSDLRFLLNLWADIKQRSESSKSPALIYHDLSLVERILRDQVTDNFSAIWVDTETDYERILRFLQRFQPSLIRRVKLYTKETPLFEQFGITEEINKALRSKVWLKSGGSIVINQTEALVAIDINTGKYVGKTARLEDTIVKTNLDAIPEIVRQIRLRDLGGILVIDFIDMDERKNRQKVLIALEEELKKDRAPSKVLQFNDFGLVAITRKRVKQSLERTLSTTCNICAGTGMVKSPVTVCNEIYVELRKMHKHLEKGDIMLRVHPEVVKTLKGNNARWLNELEEMTGRTIIVKSDPALHPEQFDIH